MMLKSWLFTPKGAAVYFGISYSALTLALVAHAYAQKPPAPPIEPVVTPPIHVYDGCAVPETSTHVWYVDSVNGKSPKDGGVGTALAPWNSLSGVISAGTFPGYTRPLLSTIPYYHITKAGRVTVADTIGDPPVNPGDTILLMSGNYGDIGIGPYNLQTINSAFVTIKAAPDQIPVLNTIYIRSTNKWMFEGIKVQSLSGTNKNTNALISVSDQGIKFPTSDIIFNDMDISTSDIIPETWTQNDWNAQGRSGYREVGGPGSGKDGVPYTNCISLTNSHIHNVTNATVVMGNNSVLTGNTIDHFGSDAVEFAASNIELNQNKITDGFGTNNGLHTDAMQGQIGPIRAGVPYNSFSNVTIDSNIIIRQTDPNLKFPQYLQGIDAFDSDWTNMTVTNNVIITSACWGMDLTSIHNSLVAGNTVVDDGQISTPGCTTMLAVGGVSHQGPPSTNTRVTNNLAERFGVGGKLDKEVTFDNNFALMGAGFAYWDAVNQKSVYYNNPQGTDANGNVSTKISTPYTDVFQVWNPAGFTYDMHIKAGSPTLNHGIGIPSINIKGTPRAPFSPGAY